MLEAIILGIVQGLTEFLPVSSSAHLILFPWFFDWQGAVNTLSFDVALHFGTLLALLVFFRQEWIAIIKSSSSRDALLWKIAVGTIPAAIAGLLLRDWIEQNRSPLLISFTLSFVALLMLMSEKKYDAEQRSGMESITMGSALFIGIAQAIALIPGVSRSGITIIAGLTKKLKREDAARFSFLLGTPAVAGASLLEARNLAGGQDFQFDIFVAGIVISAVTGYFAIKYLILFLKNFSLRPFAYYRFFLAFVIIVSLFINTNL